MQRDVVVDGLSGVVIYDSCAATSSDVECETKDARLFSVTTGDEPATHRLIVSDEGLPPQFEKLLQPYGGSFLLRAHSGRIHVSSFEAWSKAKPPVAELEVAPSSYSLRVYSRQSFDSAEHDQRMIAALGEKDWAFRKSMDKMGGYGCLLIVIAVALSIIKAAAFAVLYLAGLVIAYWAVYFLITKLPRYRRIDECRKAIEGALPHFAIVLSAIQNEEGLEGGSLPADW